MRGARCEFMPNDCFHHEVLCDVRTATLRSEPEDAQGNGMSIFGLRPFGLSAGLGRCASVVTVMRARLVSLVG